MMDEIWGYYNSAGDYLEYYVSAAGEVYDNATGELVGAYDDATDAIYYAGESIIEGVSGTVETVKDAGTSILTGAGDAAGDAAGWWGDTVQGFGRDAIVTAGGTVVLTALGLFGMYLLYKTVR
jgi:hypothetical protein